MNTRAELWQRARDLIARLAEGERDDGARDALLHDLFVYQSQNVPSYQRVAEARGAEAALPTDVFRYASVFSQPSDAVVRTFHTSGTTSGKRGEHRFADLSLYEQAALASGRRWLFPEGERMDLLILAPRASELPDSSLSHMLDLFAEHFGTSVIWAWRDGQLDEVALEEALSSQGAPLAILGTSFALVHAMEQMTRDARELPSGSRIMQTGGYKGRSRELEKEQMRSALAARFGVPETHIIAEYGMTELSSQAWEGTLRAQVLGEAPSPRSLQFPPWVRARVVDAESLRPTRGEGLLRIDDVANVDSVSAILTSDVAREREDGIVLLGRAAGAVPRGCSLAIDEALGR